MNIGLPILSGHGRLASVAGAVRDATRDTIHNFPNAFPPVRTEVLQPDEPGDLKQIMGFFTDTTLCIGCKACEVACKQWNQLPADGFHWTGNSYDNTIALSDTTWRHVAFVEQFDPGSDIGRWLMMSDVCKHCQHAPCVEVCPTGALIYNEFAMVARTAWWGARLG